MVVLLYKLISTEMFHYLPSKQRVAGSNPAGRTTTYLFEEYDIAEAAYANWFDEYEKKL